MCKSKQVVLTYGDVSARRPFIPTAAQEEPVAGIEGVTATKIVAYPNPVKSVLNISSASAIQKVEVVNIAGQSIKAFNSANTQIDLSDINAGIYFVKVYTENGSSVQK